MAKENVVVDELTSEGTRYSSLVTVPVGAKSITVIMQRKDMADDKIAYALQLFLSLDGGVSWRPHGGAGTVGGVVLDSETGIALKESGLKIGLPEPENGKRKVQATISVTAETKVGLDMEFN